MLGDARQAGHQVVLVHHQHRLGRSLVAPLAAGGPAACPRSPLAGQRGHGRGGAVALEEDLVVFLPLLLVVVPPAHALHLPTCERGKMR